MMSRRCTPKMRDKSPCLAKSVKIDSQAWACLTPQSDRDAIAQIVIGVLMLVALLIEVFA